MRGLAVSICHSLGFLTFSSSLQKLDGAVELLLALVSFNPKTRATPFDVLNSRLMADPIETGTSYYCKNDIVKSYTAYSTNSHTLLKQTDEYTTEGLMDTEIVHSFIHDGNSLAYSLSDEDDSLVLEGVLVRNPDASSSSDDDDALSSEEEKEEVETTPMPSPTKRMIRDPTLVGKRTGVTVPPFGQAKFDSPSSSGGGMLFENPDAFFAAARSGGKKMGASALSAGGSDDDGDGRRISPRGKKGGRRGANEDKKERRRREREEFEEEARRNAVRRPAILPSDEEDDEKEDGKPRSKVSSLALDCNLQCISLRLYDCASIGEWS